MPNQLQLGGIYKTEWDKRPFRVIGFDEIEVFYDCLWADNKWTFSGRFRGACSFYRTLTSFFIEKSKLIEVLPLSLEEKQAFRPELPIRLCRSKNINWNETINLDYSDFKNYAIKMFSDDFLSIKLMTDKIVALPYGEKGGRRKGSILIADNQEYFESVELIWKVKLLQEAINNNISDGIGIYRTGFEKKLPSYYIGEYIDKASFLRE